MKFLLDQGLPRSTVKQLHAVGLEAEHVGDLGMETATDQAILAEGKAGGSIIVTLDSDFHALLALSNESSPSVIRIRLQALKGEDVASIIAKVVEATTQDLVAGAAVTVTHRRLALRRLPPLRSRVAGDESKIRDSEVRRSPGPPWKPAHHWQRSLEMVFPWDVEYASVARGASFEVAHLGR